MNSTINVNPSFDLAQVVESAPQNAIILLSPGAYLLKKHVLVDKSIVMASSTGNPKDVALVREGSTALVIVAGKAIFKGLSFLSPSAPVDVVKPDADDIIEYESAVAVRDKGNAEFLHCRATSASQSAFSVRGKKARAILDHCEIRNANHGGIFCDQASSAKLVACLIVNTGLGNVDSEEKAHIDVVDSYLLGSQTTSVCTHNGGSITLRRSSVCAANESCCNAIEGSEIEAFNCRFYSHITLSPTDDQIPTGLGILVDSSRVKLVDCTFDSLFHGVWLDNNSRGRLVNCKINRCGGATVFTNRTSKFSQRNCEFCNPPTSEKIIDEEIRRQADPGAALLGKLSTSETDNDDNEYTLQARERSMRIKDGFLKFFFGTPWKGVLRSQTPVRQGGALNAYFYPNSQFGGMFVVSKDLVETSMDAPSNDDFAAYELAIASRVPFPYDKSCDQSGAPIYRRLLKLLNYVAKLILKGEKINVGDVVAIPDDWADKDVAGARLLVDEFGKFHYERPFGILKRVAFQDQLKFFESDASVDDLLDEEQNLPVSLNGKRRFGVMLLVEARPSEVQFVKTREDGVQALKSLKDAGRWPFSDLKPVD